MKNESFCEKERKRIEKLNRFQISNKFKKVGYSIVIGAFLGMIVRKLAVVDVYWLKELLRSLFLFGLLIISISKDKIEDEYIESLRSQSYRLAFLISVVYALIQPYVEYLVDNLLNKISDSNSGFSYFQVLIFMLFVQIAFFEQLKRFSK